MTSNVKGRSNFVSYPRLKLVGFLLPGFRPWASFRHEAGRTEQFGRAYCRRRGGTSPTGSPTGENIPGILCPMQGRCGLRPGGIGVERQQGIAPRWGQRALPPTLQRGGLPARTVTYGDKSRSWPVPVIAGTTCATWARLSGTAIRRPQCRILLHAKTLPWNILPIPWLTNILAFTHNGFAA